jgi:F420-dependent oxidoreductase-like protein
MRIGVNVGGEVIGAPQPVHAMAEDAREAEQLGARSAWFCNFSRGTDALTAITLAGAATSGIELGTGVVPTYPRHPFALAQQAATVQAAVGGRLVLGVGVSHRPVIEGMHGLSYAEPAAHLREYLSVLGPVLRDGEVSFSGRFYRVSGQVRVPGTSPVPIMIAALGPVMLRIAGEMTDGAITWMTGTGTIASHIVPSITAAAADAGRTAPRVVAGVPVAVGDEREARDAAARTFRRYGTLPAYQQVLEREKAGGPADVAVVGDEETVERGLRAYAEAGATDLWPVVFPVGDDRAASLERTYALLGGLAPELT